jgi:translocation and assembly module TamB
VRHFFKCTLLTVVVLFALTVAAIVYVVTTKSGTQLAWSQARAFLPNGLKIASVEGRLLGPLTIRGVDYQTHTFHLTVNKGQLRWTPADTLKNRRLYINLIAIRGVRYTQLGGAPPKARNKLTSIKLPRRISLPLDARLRTFHLRDVEYRTAPDAKPVVLRSAALSASYIGNQLTIRRLRIEAPVLSINGHASITANDDYSLQGRFDWQGTPLDYASVRGHTALRGNLRRLHIHQSIEAPYNTRAKIVVNDPLKQLDFNAKLNLKNLDLQAVDAKLPPLRLNLAIETAGVPDDFELRAQAAARDPQSQYGTLNFTLADGLAHKLPLSRS